MASRAWEFVKSRSSFGELDQGVFNYYEGYEYFNPWLSTAIQSLGVRIFGSPSLLAIRSVSLLTGLILLIAIYWIGFSLAGKQLGLLSVAFTAFSLPFFFSSHFGRSDIIVATMGFIAIAIYLNNRSTRVWLSILVGLIVAFAFEVHPNAAIYFTTIIFLLIYKYRWNLFRKPDFWGFLVGSGIGLVIFFIIHILPNPETYLRLNQIGGSISRIPPLFTFNLPIILDAFLDMPKMILFLYPQIIIIIWGIFRFRKVRPNYVITLVVINISLLLGFTLLIRNKFLNYYAILVIPGLCLLIAAVFNDLFSAPIKNKSEFWFRRITIIFILILPIIPWIRYDFTESYRHTQLKVSKAVTHNDTVMGNQVYWFGLWEHDYLSWENLPFYKRHHSGSQLEDAFIFLKPDILIIDDHVRNFIFDDENRPMYIQQLQIPEKELYSFLKQNADLVTTIEEGEGFTLLIFRINWDTEES